MKHFDPQAESMRVTGQACGGCIGLAHFILDHVAATVAVSNSGLALLSDYSNDQKEEADWPGAALLLSEAALLHYRLSGFSNSQIADKFCFSIELCAWRCRMTDVNKRLVCKSRA